ncbi:MAG: polyprenyl synthetase family protein, partial [Desulfobacteraceae bacterium]|nr:polyprenyl synthetase family protein [Desulfobacteraceae bacterium]
CFGTSRTALPVSSRRRSRSMFPERLKTFAAEFDQWFKEYLTPRGDVPPELLEAVHYSALAPGKRIRPYLVGRCCELAGGRTSDAFPAAAAIECVHAFSLIHDDLPAMDDDDLRRGKPTCHKAFNEATAILAGDALLTAAFEVLAARGGDDHGVDSLKYLQVVYLIARASGYSGMVQGQMMDLSFEGKTIGREELERLQHYKTGALIEVSLRAGAILGGGSPEQIAALGAYGRHIGLAFQMADDILNIEGKPEMLGKAVGSDEALGKATAPSVMGLEGAKARAGELVESALAALRIFDMKGEPLAALARYVIERRK